MMIRRARRRKRLSKEHIVIIILNAVCVLLMVAAIIARSLLITPLFAQSAAAKAWGEGYAHVSVFYEEGAGLNAEGIRRLHTGLDTKLTEASISAASEDARIYVDCYSLVSKLSVSSERMSGSYTAFVVGGDFFTFHPLKLKSGYYFSGSDIMQDRVVLDEEAAWQLFGSDDVAGMQVRIFDKPFIVAGVIAREDDLASELAYSQGPAIYMSYDAYSLEREDAVITSYEIALPNPISGFALSMVEGVVTASEQSRESVDNSARYGIRNIMGVLGALGERSMRTKAVFFPYWENAARLVEDRVALLVLMMFILPVFPLVTLCVIGTRLWNRRKWRITDIKDYYERKRDEKWTKEWEASRAAGQNPQVHEAQYRVLDEETDIYAGEEPVTTTLKKRKRKKYVWNKLLRKRK